MLNYPSVPRNVEAPSLKFLETGNKSFKTQSRNCTNVVSEEIRDKVIDFYNQDISRAAPGMTDSSILRVGEKDQKINPGNTKLF